MATLQELSEQYTFGTEAIRMRIEGLDRSQLLARPDARGNHIVWLLGHIAASRGTMLEWLGHKELSPVGKGEHDLFGMGSKVAAEDVYPPTEELLGLIEIRGKALGELVPALSDEEADTPWELQLPFKPDTKRSMLRFMYFHETLHYGQISYLASWLGSPLGL